MMVVSIVSPNQQGYPSYPTTLPPYVGAVMFETFLYGFYSILFPICIYVLLQRRKTIQWVLLVSAVAMFTIATTDFIYTCYLVFQKLFKTGITFTDLRPKYWLYVTNNVLADTLLLYRCYAIWDYNIRVVLGPIVLLIAGTACGYVFEGSQPHLFVHAWIYLTLTLILNVILTSLTAGRIRWLARNAWLLLGRTLTQRYNTTMAILVESGFIYSFYVGLNLAVKHNQVAHTVLDAGLIQIVGIVPTLIIVQVGLGCAVRDLDANGSLKSNIATIDKSIQSELHSVPSGGCLGASNDTFAYHSDLEK